MQKPTVFLHVGMPKTATTSLQEFFYLNRKIMATVYKVHYVSSPGDKNHLKMAAFASPDSTRDLLEAQLANSAAERQSFYLKFRKEISKIMGKGGHALVSNEHMASRIKDIDGLKELKSLTEGITDEVKIIIYLRRQDKFMFSSYSTWIKSGGSGRFKSERYKQKKFDYLSLLDKWAKVFGKDNIIVRPFEKSGWKGGTIYSDFLSVLGIKDTSKFQNIATSANKSLDRAQLAFLAKFNKHVDAFDGDKKSKLRGKVVEYLEAMSTADKIQLSADEVKEILNYFKAANGKISNDFMNGATLFSNEIPSKEENSVPKLTVDKAMEITAALWVEQQKIINTKTLKGVFGRN